LLLVHGNGGSINSVRSLRFKQQQAMMLQEPHIAVSELQKITASTLVIGADSDIMPLSHTLEIFTGIPHAQLFIVPGTTHGMIRTASEFYNSVVARFLDAPFTRPQSVQ
jgi:pimeloyl-ACP methyl ester carboxylesterase